MPLLIANKLLRYVEIVVSLLEKAEKREKLLKEVRECCTKLRPLEREAEGRHRAQSDIADGVHKKLEEASARLKKKGWEQESAAAVLRYEYCWDHTRMYADRASRGLKRGFKQALTVNPHNKIAAKAAAYPLDLIVLLMPRILYMPGWNEQEAMFMYMRYLTELVSLYAVSPLTKLIN